MKQRPLRIIVQGQNPSEADHYQGLEWIDLETNCVRETTDGRIVRYGYWYYHSLVGPRSDIARARIEGKNGVEAIAYIQDAYDEDFHLQARLNRMLGIKLKRESRKK